MPFEYKKKNRRREIPKYIVLRAIEQVSKGAKIKTTARKYDIPRSNLQRYLKQSNEIDMYSSKYISNQIFTKDEEQKISEGLTTSSKLDYNVFKMQTRLLAYDYACAIRKKIPENWTRNKIASKDWLRGFLKRNPLVHQKLSSIKMENNYYSDETVFGSLEKESFDEDFILILK